GSAPGGAPDRNPAPRARAGTGSGRLPRPARGSRSGARGGACGDSGAGARRRVLALAAGPAGEGGGGPVRRALYVLLSTIAFILVSPVLLLARKTRRGLLERFGFYRSEAVPQGGWPRVWLHGASAGDLQALSPMIARFRERFPDARIFLTTMTDTGRAMAEQRLSAQVDGVLYAPWDLPGATRRAMRALRPDLLVLEYAEIWPNLIHAARAAGSRVVLTNGRFSPERLRGYRTLFAVFGNPLTELDLLLMREDDEAERALSLGAPLDRVWVTGNTKFDGLAVPEPSPEDEALRTALGLPQDAPVLMGGSTHEGEEEILLSVWQRLREAHP